MSHNSFQIDGVCMSHILSHLFGDAEAGYTRTGKSTTRCSTQICKVMITWERKGGKSACSSQDLSISLRESEDTRPLGFAFEVMQVPSSALNVAKRLEINHLQ